MKRFLVNEQIKKHDTIESSNVVIYFLTNKFIKSDEFKQNWSKKGNKLILIILLESPIRSSSALDLNNFFVSNFHILMSLAEKEEIIHRNEIFISRLINLKILKNFNLNLISTTDRNQVIIKTENLCYIFLKLETIGNNEVIVKIRPHSDKILIINWNICKIIGRIENQEIWRQEFCWIDHLNQILVYQRNRSSSVQDAIFSLFTNTGNLVRSVFSLRNYPYLVNSVAYNKNIFEVFLNVFNRQHQMRQILVLDENFNLIRKIDNALTNPELQINYVSRIEIFDVVFAIFHFNSKYAFLQEIKEEISKGNIYIFDKLSYSIVGAIKTKHRLMMVFENKAIFIDRRDSCYIIKSIKLLKAASLDSDAFCQFNNPYKPPHLLSNPYLLSCGHSACLDCIHQNYNLFKKTLQCVICNQELRLPQHLESMNKSIIIELLNEHLLNILIDKNKNVISDIGMFYAFILKPSLKRLIFGLR